MAVIVVVVAVYDGLPIGMGSAKARLTTAAEHVRTPKLHSILDWCILGWIIRSCVLGASLHYAAFLRARLPQQLVVSRHQPHRQLHPCAFMRHILACVDDSGHGEPYTICIRIYSNYS